jgi:hypothetical protein
VVSCGCYGLVLNMRGLLRAVVRGLREGAGARNGAAAIVKPITRDVPVGNRDYGWAPHQPDADPLHHAGSLSLSRRGRPMLSPHAKAASCRLTRRIRSDFNAQIPAARLTAASVHIVVLASFAAPAGKYLTSFIR